MNIAEMEVADADLAALADLSPRRIRQLATDGKLTRVGRNRFKLGDALRVLLAEAAENNEVSELKKERLRKLTAEATMAELELARQTGQVALIDEFRRVWEGRFAIIRTNMLSLPSRVVPRVIGETDERLVKAVLTEEIKTVLHNAAEAEIDLPEEDNEDQDNEP